MPDATNPQAFNRYTYVLNSPFTLIDPSGHRPSDGCDYEGCSLLNGFDSDSTWQAPDGTQTPWDPVVASDQDYNPITEAVIPGIAVLFGVASLPTAVGYFAGEVAWPALIRGGQAVASWLCLDGNCLNEAEVIYDRALPAGNGATDILGRTIRISPFGSTLDKMQALYHEQVHVFFTPRGPFQQIRAGIRYWAYENSNLFRYAEEAIAESTAQLRTGGSLRTGLSFPLIGYDITPARVAIEGGLVAGGTTLGGIGLGQMLENWFNLNVEQEP